MLRKRLITTLTFNQGVLFRTKHFEPDYRYTANFVDAWSVDEIVLLDITRPEHFDRAVFFDVVRHFADRCFVPLAVGGGIRSVEHVRELLACGADKVVLNTGILERPELITEVAKPFGSQCVVASIDARKQGDGYRVFKGCGREPTGLDPRQWAQRAEALGAGEIFLTSIDKDGSLEGYDNELNAHVASAVTIPLIVSGGAGKWQDFVDGFTVGNASAVSTSNIYHFTETSIRSAKSYLKANGIEVRT